MKDRKPRKTAKSKQTSWPTIFKAQECVWSSSVEDRRKARLRSPCPPTYGLKQPAVHTALSELAFAKLGDFIDDQGQMVVEKIRARGHMVKKYEARVIRSLSNDQVTVTSVQIELQDGHEALIDIGKSQVSASRQAASFIKVSS